MPAASGLAGLPRLMPGGTLCHSAHYTLTAEVHANLSRDHWTGTGKFQVPYISWGIKDPSNFLLKVKPVVDVELELSGSVKSAN